MRKTKRNTKVDIFALCIIAVAFFTGCWGEKTEDSASITVFAAASTTNAILDIADKFTETTGLEVITNFASSSTLAQQIEAGADVDVYISANEKWADYLEKNDFCLERKTLLKNRIVIIAPSDSTLTAESAEVLLADDIINIAMGDPSHVPAGRYGKEALIKAECWEHLSSRVIAAKDVRSALVYVETAAAEAGIVYSTDAAISEKVKTIYQFPEDATAKPISYPAIIMKNAKVPANGKKFFEFLESNTAKAIFEEYGFITI